MIPNDSQQTVDSGGTENWRKGENRLKTDLKQT